MRVGVKGFNYLFVAENLVVHDHDGCCVDPNYFNEDRRLKMLTEDISTQLEEDGRRCFKIIFKNVFIKIISKYLVANFNKK